MCAMLPENEPARLRFYVALRETVSSFSFLLFRIRRPAIMARRGDFHFQEK